MALLAEEIVEEWLNRQGYFTIRGIKIGVHEIDILAVRFKGKECPECRHIEVQASMRPVSYISRIPKQLQKTGRAANTTSRSQEELKKGVQEWVETKFRRADKIALMNKLCNAKWSSELVLNNVKSEDEVSLIQGHGVKIVWLKDIIEALTKNKFPVTSACGADFIDLIQCGAASLKRKKSKKIQNSKIQDKFNKNSIKTKIQSKQKFKTLFITYYNSPNCERNPKGAGRT